MKKLFSFIAVLCLSLPLCGCYDNREIDQTAYVIAIGIDKGKDIFSYTFQISSPLAMGSGGETSAPEGEGENTRVENIVIGANDLYEARNMLNNFLSKDINLSHLKIIVTSEEVAKEGLSSHMTFLLREREIRPNTRLCISEKSAEDFLKGINPALEANTAEYYDLIAENGSLYAPPKTLRDFVNEESLFASTIPIGKISGYEKSSEFSAESSSPLRVSSSKSEFSGLYLMKDYKIAGTLTPTQSKIYGLLKKSRGDTDLSILKDNKQHMVRLTSHSGAVFSVDYTKDAITVNMNIKFTAEISSAGDKLREADIKEYLEKEAYSLFISAKDAGCDIFGAGNCLRRRCKTIAEWEKINWNEKFKSVYFSPSITVMTERSNSGTM